MGAASVLAAVFRAPLTASLLLFELTRDYNAMLPLLASCGVASLVGDVLEQRQELRKHRDRDTVSWGDLSSKPEASMQPNGKNERVSYIPAPNGAS